MKNASFYILAILVLGLIGNPLSQHALNYQYNTSDNDNTLGVNAFAEFDEDEQETYDDEQEREHDESEEDNEENNDGSDDSEDEGHEDENQDEENTSEEDAKEAISDAQEEIKKSQEKIMKAKQKGKDTSASELALEESQNKLEEAQQNFEFGAYEMAEESADEAEDLASDARMSLLGKSIEDEESEDDELEDESDEDLDESEDDMEDSEDDAEDSEDDTDDNKQDRQKSEAKTEQIISKLEQKIEQLEQRIQSLLEKVQNGKYFGNLENTDQTTKSYTMSFDGTATSMQDQGVSAPVSGDVFVETLVTKDGYSKLRVTGGQIDIGQTTYDIVFGKARVTDNSSDQGSFILLVAEIMDDNGDITTIRMNLDSVQSFQMADTQPVDLQIGSPQSKIAGQWFLEGTGSLSS